MKSVARTGQTTVNYDYDAGGRLVRRTKGSEVTMSYWLGLNQIAEERADSGAEVFRPDVESDWDPEDADNGWMLFGDENDVISYELDPMRGKHLHLEADGFFGAGEAVHGPQHPAIV